MSKERGLIVAVLRNFINSFKPKSGRAILMGKDEYGNAYYEIPSSANRRKASRWFVPPVKDKFDSEMPSEWDAWLRGRRNVIPTVEEIMSNAAIAELKKKNAAELETKEPTGIPPPIKEGVTAFPQYEEFEVWPGKERKYKS